jgi:hypothetical protein
LWKTLKETYGKQTSASLHGLKVALANTKLRPGESLHNHLTDLQSKKEILIRAGGHCSDKDFIFWLLESLTDEYGGIVDSIHTMNNAQNEMTADDIMNLLLNKSDRLKVASSTVTSSGKKMTAFRACGACARFYTPRTLATAVLPGER